MFPKKIKNQLAKKRDWFNSQKKSKIGLSQENIYLTSHVRQEAHKTRPLHGLRQTPLVLGAGAGVFGVDNFGLAGNEPAQKLDIFVIDVIQVLRAEKTLFRNHRFLKLRIKKAGLPA